MNAGLYLRLLASILMLGLLVRLDMVRNVSRIRSVLAVFLDTSRSMSLGTRMTDAREVVKTIPSERRGLKILPFLFDSRPKSVDLNGLIKAGASGQSTNIAVALKMLEKSGSADGAVIISDGRDNSGLSPIKTFGDDLAIQNMSPETFAGRLGLPVFAIGTGSETDFKDIRIADVNCAVDAFKNISLPILVNIETHGFSRRKITVTLKEGEELLGASEIVLPAASSATVTAALDFIPARGGTYDLVIEIPRIKGELTYLNNQARFSVAVRREKLRVLYISGKPGPEYAFLRRLLKADPAVELVSFVILRDVQDVPPVPENELSLIPFPAQEVLLKQLPSFDLVILEDFIFYRYGISQANIQAISKFVKSGGGFILKGMQTVFGQASPYKGTVIEEMSPLPIGSPDTVFLEKLSPPLTPSPLPPHPTLSLRERGRGEGGEGGGEGNKGAVPVFRGFAIRDYGRGRVAALAASSTWRWSLSKGDDTGSASSPHGGALKDESVLKHESASPPVTELQRGNGAYPSSYEKASTSPPAQVYQKFWTDLIRWLTKYGEYEDSIKVEVKVKKNKSVDEYDNPSPDFQLLQTIAQVTGGKFIRAKDATPEWIEENLTNIGTPQTIEKKLDAAEYIWLLFVIVGLLIAAWIM